MRIRIYNTDGYYPREGGVFEIDIILKVSTLFRWEAAKARKRHTAHQAITRNNKNNYYTLTRSEIIFDCLKKL